MTVLDLYAGPGGWDEALRLLDVHLVEGVELDPDACATATAAGHLRTRGDIRTLDPLDFDDVTGLIASPPCQKFSAAGKGEGVATIDDLNLALAEIADGRDCSEAAAAHGIVTSEGNSATLVLEPMRFVRDLLPRWIAFEEVKEVLPVWETYAEILTAIGYSVWTGVLNAADYGVPQTRRRAFLMASRDGHVTRPKPTHSATEEWTLFDERKPWMTMAEALGWGEAECVAANALAPEPARDPARALWPLWRPATTIVRSFRPDIVAVPGYRMPGDGPRQNQPGSIYVTPEQMATLQAIRTDYPFTARGLTKRLSLIGAILPPPQAMAVLKPLLDLQYGACVECGNDDPHPGASRCLDCMEAAA